MPVSLRPKSILGRFFMQTAIWMPIAFFFWYQTSWLLTLPANWLTEVVLNLIHPGTIEEIVGIGRTTEFRTGFETTIPGPEGTPRTGQITLAINPLIYSWNLPVLLALLFAADERFFSMTKLVIGYLLLLPAHVWGMTFEALLRLTLQTDAEVREALGFAPWGLELIGLGYQFGYLMLPFIAAVTIWIFLNLRLVENLLERDRITGQ